MEEASGDNQKGGVLASSGLVQVSGTSRGLKTQTSTQDLGGPAHHLAESFIKWRPGSAAHSNPLRALIKSLKKMLLYSQFTVLC